MNDMSSGVDQPDAPLALFADVGAGFWGLLAGGSAPRLAVGRLTEGDTELLAATVDLTDPEVWELTAAGCALRFERAAATTATEDLSCALEPCRVSGSITLGGVECELDIGGARSDELGLTGGASVRIFAAWFPAGHEIALLSRRPRDSRGHDRDVICVAARGEDHPLVLDPRLSTTYDGTGAPRRVGLELWLADEADGDQFPRRVAGEATGSHVATGQLSAHAFNCTSRGEPGAGVYVLAASA